MQAAPTKTYDVLSATHQNTSNWVLVTHRPGAGARGTTPTAPTRLATSRLPTSLGRWGVRLSSPSSRR